MKFNRESAAALTAVLLFAGLPVDGAKTPVVRVPPPGKSAGKHGRGEKRSREALTVPKPTEEEQQGKGHSHQTGDDTAPAGGSTNATQKDESADSAALAAIIESIRAIKSQNHARAEELYRRTLLLLEEMPSASELQATLRKAFPDLAKNEAASTGLLRYIQHLHPSNMRIDSQAIDTSQLERMLKAGIEYAGEVHGKESAQYARAVLDLILLYSRQARFSETAPLVTQAANAFAKTKGHEQRLLAGTMLEIASSFLGSNRPIEAEMMYAPVLAACSSASWSDTDSIVAQLNQLAQTSFYSKRYDQAETVRRAILALRERAEPPDELKLARERRQLADVLAGRRNYGAAEELYKLALDAQERNQDGQTSELLHTMTGLTKLYLTTRRPAEARALEPRLSALSSRIPQQERQAAFRSMLELACDFGYAGEHQSALDLFKRSIAQSKFWSYNDYEFRQTAEKLSQTYMMAGAALEAKKIVLAYLDSRDENQPQDASQIKMLTDVAGFLVMNDQIEEASQLGKRATDMCQPNQVRNLSSYIKQLADAYCAKSRFKEAEDLYVSILSKEAPKRIDDLRQWFRINLDLATIYLQQKKVEAAVGIYHRIVDATAAADGDDLMLGKDIKELLDLYIADNQPQQASGFMSELTSYSHYRTADGSTHVLLRVADRFASYDPTRAELMFKRVIGTLRQNRGVDSRRYIQILTNYAGFLDRYGRFEQAREVRRELNDIKGRLPTGEGG